ncbi:MAG: hypothetical protein FWG09_07975 [Synergistaceae bacterium]|nr:hypothetical protein [Synergistaceae bacterium]
MLSCVWFVTLKRVWETAVLSCIASELCEKFDTQVTIYTRGGTEGLEKLNAYSWNSLRPIEKSLIILGKSKLWHLWSYEGEAPFWWGMIRTRVRTMHTKLNGRGKWRGHPSVMAYALAGNGETVIHPGFESMVESSVNWVPNTDDLYLENGDMSDALLGAYASLNGTRVTAPHTAVLDEILSPGGYTRKAPAASDQSENFPTIEPEESNVNEDDTDDTQDSQAASSGVASCARRHIQSKFQPAESAKKLASLYRKILGMKG